MAAESDIKRWSNLPAISDLYEFESYTYDPFRRKLTLCCNNPSVNNLLIRPQDQPAIDARLRVGPRVFLPGYPKGV